MFMNLLWVSISRPYITKRRIWDAIFVIWSLMLCHSWANISQTFMYCLRKRQAKVQPTKKLNVNFVINCFFTNRTWRIMLIHNTIIQISVELTVKKCFQMIGHWKITKGITMWKVLQYLSVTYVTKFFHHILFWGITVQKYTIKHLVKTFCNVTNVTQNISQKSHYHYEVNMLLVKFVEKNLVIPHHWENTWMKSTMIQLQHSVVNATNFSRISEIMWLKCI